MIVIDVDSLSESSPSEWFYDSLYCVSLSCLDESLMPNGRYSFAYGKDRIFVLDKFIDYAIRIYDNSGRYLGKLDKRGHSPGMYSLAYDLLVDETAEMLVVLDPTGKIVRYSIADDYAYKDDICFQEVLPAAHNIALLSQDEYIVYSRSAEKPLYHCSFIDKKTTPLTYSVPSWLRLSPFMYSSYPFYNNKGQLFYFDSLSGAVFSVNRNGLKSLFRWDFGEYQLRQKDIADNQPLTYYVSLLNKSSYRHVGPFSHVAETDHFIYASFLFRGQHCTLIYNKTAKSACLFHRASNGDAFHLGKFENGVMYVPDTHSRPFTVTRYVMK